MTDTSPSSEFRYDPVAISSESTVVAQYQAQPSSQTEYQSEAALEAAFIAQLQQQAYDYINITSADELVANLRAELEALNNITFTDAEWSRLFTQTIANAKAGIVDKARIIQEDWVLPLKRDDGSTRNIYLLDKVHIHNNRLQVINQYETTGKHANRYDVTILVNGLPLVHVELKRRGVDLREAFNQIDRYQRDSFWADSGLFEYVQLFVISNGTHTKYYSNTTRVRHVGETKAAKPGVKRTSNSFEFTSWWADGDNTVIADLPSFTKTFFAKHSLLNVLTKYCVFTIDRDLLVMRPYQIASTERIMQRIVVSSNDKARLGTLAAGGYVWHTTGSGKTLTSFKTAQLASRLPDVDKVIFVVDRKDLDWQTQKEYNRFEEGAANGNKSTAQLKKQIEDPNSRIIVTTIQKLAIFCTQNEKHDAYRGRFVLIFDECHRSQFGDMHTLIKKRFKNYNLFGFTGTPIFAANAASGGNPQLKTTEQAFGEKLHTYTIVNAINDKNVLPFRIDYVNTFKLPEQLTDAQVNAIDIEQALLAPERITKVVSYIRERFDQKTLRNAAFAPEKRRKLGFNSLFATASIDAAKRYYLEFKAQQAELPIDQRLRVGIIFSFAANEEVSDSGFTAEEGFETDLLDGASRDFLDAAIDDYNELFKTNFDTSADRFQQYYTDVSERLKKRDLDVVIVVNMFLTGFDATTLNTLWVDKNLRQHGLIQAFSRTNRILNSVKTYGNIVSFRDLEEQTNEAIALFGDRSAYGIVILKPYGEYLGDYNRLVDEMQAEYPVPGALIFGEEAEKRFVELWSALLRLRNILKSFDEFAQDDRLSDFEQQERQSTYVQIWQDRKNNSDADKVSILDDVVFEMELIKQVEVNIDFILNMVKKYQESKRLGQSDIEVLADVQRSMDASITLRSKKNLIERFIDQINVDSDIDSNWSEFVIEQRNRELDDLIAAEQLKPEETRAFMAKSFDLGTVPTAGPAITKLLPPGDLFSVGNGHGLKKQTVTERLLAFFDRFFGLG